MSKLTNSLGYSNGVPYTAFDIGAVRQIRHLLHFNRKASSAIVRRFVAIILKNKIEEFHGDDGRKKQLQEWEIHGIWAIIRLWDVDENLKWLNNPHSFSGMWRRTWREEIKKKSGITSDYMINHLLARMEDHGLISRRHPMCSNSKARELWIMLHADRVVGIVDQANELAKKDTKFGRLMKTKKHVKLVDKNKSVSGSIVEEKQDRQELPSHVKGFTDFFYSNPNNCLSLIEGDKSTTGGSDISITPGKKGTIPLDWEQYSFSEATYKVMQVLQSCGIFPLSQFTFPVLKRIDYWTSKAVPDGHRMTESRVKEAVNQLQCYSEPGAWQLKIDDVTDFVDWWISLLRKTRQILCDNDSGMAQTYAEHFNKQDMVQNLQDEVRFIELVTMRNSNAINKVFQGDVTKFILAGGIVNTCASSRWNLLSQLACLHNQKVDLTDIVEARWQDLQADLRASPELFYFLEAELPLQEWARLTDTDCDYLRQKAQRMNENSQRTAALAEAAIM